MNEPEKRIRDFLTPEPEILAKYDAWFQIIYSELVSINQALFYLEKISTFPFLKLHVHHDDYTFWRFQTHYLRQYIVIALYRLIVAEDGLALTRFRGEIRKQISDDKAKSDLAAQIKNVDFHRQIGELKEKIEPMRNEYVAHLSDTLLISPANLLSLSDMRRILDLGHEFFNALEFGVHHGIWIWSYLDDRHREQLKNTDIDRLLLATAKRSRLVASTREKIKEDSSFFKHPDISDSDLETINEYRERAGNKRITREDLTNDDSGQ
jgi:hypothetical protein